MDGKYYRWLYCKTFFKKFIYGDFPSKLPKKEVVISNWFHLNALSIGVLTVPS